MPCRLDYRRPLKTRTAAFQAILSEQAAASGKPAAVIEKMVTGRMSKYYEEHCLAEQKFLVHDGDGQPPKVGKAAQASGADVLGFLRFQVGEAQHDDAAADDA